MMRTLLRLLVACACAGAVSFAVAASATAAFQFNGAPIALTATGRAPQFVESTGSSISFNCLATQLGMTVQADGTGVVPRGRAVFATCSIPGLGTATVTQLGDWPISTTALLSGGRIVGLAVVISLPTGGGLRFSFGGCTFEFAGTLTSLQTTTATTPPALVTITSLPFASLTLGLVVQNATGCAGTGIANGDLARLNVGLSLSTSLSGTLVP